ncbi:MAG TPA: helix-turn-helix transcriptional regulator [Methylomusa anaerophila]|uniref:Transcriptional repressor DicA n=1 Tax=Methylomusa anaerophila TaxID=1930071 RepID=A0A348AIW8_9FIRM|nr:helix-turn-helix transcriptional regulator [Methylomusa anaerophila]BBB91016.1 transcriptional repressor DicA [Methylomusa anaerophila]HML88887.1 helix-turn-helix transcriptional regulator [Methylomusa anaerophila]
MGNFHVRLQKAMDRANMKQSELSEKTGIGKSSISQYLSGDYEPKQKNIYKLATVLNVAPSYLLGYTDDLTNYNDFDLTAELQGPVLDHFDGNIKKALAFQKAVAEDALKEDTSSPSINRHLIYETIDPSEAIAKVISSITPEGIELFPGVGTLSREVLLKHILSPEEQEALKLAKNKKYTDLVNRNLEEHTQSSTPLPPLSSKDEREIAKDLEAMLTSLDDKSGMAAFNEPEDEEDRELLKASLEYSMRLAKQIAKKKFTPKKHRKE